MIGRHVVAAVLSVVMLPTLAFAGSSNDFHVDAETQLESDHVAKEVYGNSSGSAEYKQQMKGYLSPQAIARQKKAYSDYFKENGLTIEGETARVRRETAKMLGGEAGIRKKIAAKDKEMKALYNGNSKVKRAKSKSLPKRRTDGYLKGY